MAFKSNQRNVKLMQEHYVEGRHKGGAWKVVLPVLIILLVFVVGLVWLAYKLFVWLYQLI